MVPPPFKKPAVIFRREMFRSAVLMPSTAFLSRLLQMCMAVWVHHVIRSQKTGQDTADSWMGKHLIQRGDFLEDMVPRVSLFLKYCCGSPGRFLRGHRVNRGGL